MQSTRAAKTKLLVGMVLFVGQLTSVGFAASRPSVDTPAPPPKEGHVLVIVEIFPGLAIGTIERCITLNFYSNCHEPPVQCAVAMEFGSVPSTGLSALFFDTDEDCPVNVHEVVAVTVADELHTLRSVADIALNEDTLIVSARGNPADGGNALVSGNLDGWNPRTLPPNAATINIFDFAIFIAQDAQEFPSADTSCDLQANHADLNADAVVDWMDYETLSDHFLMQAQTTDCQAPQRQSRPLMEVSVDELIDAGLDALSAADLNGDGWVDRQDMIAFEQSYRKPRR